MLMLLFYALTIIIALWVYTTTYYITSTSINYYLEQPF